MKKVFLSLLVFFVIFSASASPREQGPRISLKNSTGYEVFEIYVSPSTSDDWGGDYLVNTTLDDGDTFTLVLPRPLSEVNIYDIQFVDIDGDTYSRFDVVINNESVIEMTFDDIDDDYGDYF